MKPTSSPRPVLRRACALLGTAAIAVSLAVAGSASAQAAPALASAAAPQCVHVIKVDHDWAGFPRAKIRNDCASSQRVKIIWAGAPDSPCKQLGSGSSYTDSTGVFGRFDGIQRC